MDSSGRAGAYASTLALRARLKAAAALVGIVAAFGVILLLGGSDAFGGGLRTVVASVMVVFALICALRFKSFVDASGRAAVGARSERRVARAITRAQPQLLVNGALLGAGGDADHVVLGPICAVVETKTGSGAVRYSDGLWAGRRRIPGDPVAQAKRQAAALGRRAGVFAAAVVCIPDMTTRPFQVQGTWVCSLDDLASVLAGLPAVLDRVRAKAVFEALTR